MMNFDNKLINDVKGLKPNQEKHQFYFDIQPKFTSILLHIYIIVSKCHTMDYINAENVLFYTF